MPLSPRSMVPLKALKNAPYNPPKRIQLDASMIGLRDSMELLGLLHPISITKDRWIIDGHRRVTCGKLLGWKEIECNIIEGQTAESVFSSINVTAKRLSGNEALVVWLKNPQACPFKVRTVFGKMDAVLGRKRLEKLCDHGRSNRIFDVAKRVCQYVDKTDDPFLCDVVDWLDRKNILGIIDKVIDAGTDATKLMRAIKGDRTLSLQLIVSENGNH